MASAIRMFLTQAVANNGFPFAIKKNVAGHGPYAAMSEEEMLAKLERSRNHEREGGYRDADAVISDMRAKYGI